MAAHHAEMTGIRATANTSSMKGSSRAIGDASGPGIPKAAIDFRVPLRVKKLCDTRDREHSSQQKTRQ